MTTGNPLYDNMPPEIKAGMLAQIRGAQAPATIPGQIPPSGVQQSPQAPAIASQGAPVANPKPMATPVKPPVPLGHQIAQEQTNVNAPQTPEIAKPIAMPDSGMPSINPTPHAQVIAPRGTVEGDENYRGHLLNTGSGISQIANKIEGSQFGQNHPTLAKILGYGAQGAATLGDIGLRMASPLAETMVPGTEGHHQMLVNQSARQLTQDESSLGKAAQVGALQQEGDLHEQQARAAELTPATEQESTALGIPVGTMINAASRAALAKQSGINHTKVETTGMTTQSREDIAAANNLTKEKVASLKPEQRDDRAIRLMEKPPESRTQEENAYLGSYAKWVQQTKVEPGIARAAAYGQFRPVQVLGPDGDVHYDYSGNAIKNGASTPGSMNFKTALGMAHYMTSGKGGSTLTAYRTAYDHLDLLQQASNALENGDVQGLNRLDNAFKEQFGSSAPTNFNAVKTMLSGEIANVAKSSGATDQEIAAARDEMNRAQSPEQIRGIIQTNQGLMDQKAQEMYHQYQSGMQGQPTFGHGGQTQPATQGATPPAGAKIIKWEDVK
jgi:hypothetical protein